MDTKRTRPPSSIFFGCRWIVLYCGLATGLFQPILVIQVPANCVPDACLKRLKRFPTQCLSYFGGIESIATVMARTILDKVHQLTRIAAVLRRKIIKRVADQF